MKHKVFIADRGNMRKIYFLFAFYLFIFF